ncbi:hypothetical protein CBS101457_004430 [Exobasidium rhododendri]|nr:hypothetical protein CBS101457_004430 [Exobasidium rhododendri]
MSRTGAKKQSVSSASKSKALKNAGPSGQAGPKRKSSSQVKAGNAVKKTTGAQRRVRDEEKRLKLDHSISGISTSHIPDTQQMKRTHGKTGAASSMEATIKGLQAL